jgi:hypothetical protein
MRALVFLAALLCAVFNAPSAFAWGDVGHRVICQIAYEELKPEIKSRVDALVAIDPKFRTFADGCTWPDVFPRQRPPEHFADLPRTAKGIEVAHPCPVADRCVISAILNDTRDLPKEAGLEGCVLEAVMPPTPPILEGSLARLTSPAAFAAVLKPLRRVNWFVYAKRPFAGPKAEWLGGIRPRRGRPDRAILPSGKGQL